MLNVPSGTLFKSNCDIRCRLEQGLIFYMHAFVFHTWNLIGEWFVCPPFRMIKLTIDGSLDLSYEFINECLSTIEVSINGPGLIFAISVGGRAAHIDLNRFKFELSGWSTVEVGVNFDCRKEWIFIHMQELYSQGTISNGDAHCLCHGSIHSYFGKDIDIVKDNVVLQGNIEDMIASRAGL